MEGVCMCSPKFKSSDGICIPDENFSVVGDVCQTSTVVVNGECNAQTKRVQCEAGTTNVGNSICIGSNEKLLGDACGTGDSCYSYFPGQLAQRAQCSGGVCGCAVNTIWEGTTCRPRRFSDSCSLTLQCSASHSCVDAKCVCKNGQKIFMDYCFGSEDYGQVAEKSNCTFEAKCALGLKCATCTENPYPTCVKIDSGAPRSAYLAPWIVAALMMSLTKPFF
ncbi:tenascin-X-like [Liolophura sinensis]|uniref:tenascin-X-like n=1 Tax=Liolophura sinensis TaxID=3198878 RepID=UPI0031583070